MSEFEKELDRRANHYARFFFGGVIVGAGMTLAALVPYL